MHRIVLPILIRGISICRILFICRIKYLRPSHFFLTKGFVLVMLFFPSLSCFNLSIFKNVINWMLAILRLISSIDVSFEKWIWMIINKPVENVSAYTRFGFRALFTSKCILLWWLASIFQAMKDWIWFASRCVWGPLVTPKLWLFSSWLKK